MKHRTARSVPSSSRRLAAAAIASAAVFCLSAPLAANAAASDTAASATHTAGAKMRDMAVTTKAKAALVGASGLDSGDVHVSTRNGRVTLTGSVPDAAQKPLAEAAVKGVDGVRSVQDQLTIHEK